jgi:BlaI family penicillinase repressor
MVMNFHQYKTFPRQPAFQAGSLQLLKMEKNPRDPHIEPYGSVYLVTTKFVDMGASKPLKPTESELEILQVLWVKGEATVREVHDELSRARDIGYTTALKLLQIMYEKGLVSRDDSAKTHVYRPAVTRERTQKHLVGKMIDTLFSGSSSELVLQALGNHKASSSELDEIQKLLDQLRKE